MYMCIYICVYTHIYIFIYIYMHIRIKMFTYIETDRDIDIYIDKTELQIYILIWIHVHIYIYIYIYTYIYRCTCRLLNRQLSAKFTIQTHWELTLRTLTMLMIYHSTLLRADFDKAHYANCSIAAAMGLLRLVGSLKL